MPGRHVAGETLDTIPRTMASQQRWVNRIGIANVPKVPEKENGHLATPQITLVGQLW